MNAVTEATAAAVVANQKRLNAQSDCATEILSRFVGRPFTHESVLLALRLAYETGRRDHLLESMRDFRDELRRESDATVAQS